MTIFPWIQRFFYFLHQISQSSHEFNNFFSFFVQLNCFTNFLQLQWFFIFLLFFFFDMKSMLFLVSLAHFVQLVSRIFCHFHYSFSFHTVVIMYGIELHISWFFNFLSGNWKNHQFPGREKPGKQEKSEKFIFRIINPYLSIKQFLAVSTLTSSFTIEIFLSQWFNTIDKTVAKHQKFLSISTLTGSFTLEIFIHNGETQ